MIRLNIHRNFVLVALVTCLPLSAPDPTWAADGFAKVGTFGALWEKLARSPRSEALGGSDMAVATGPFATLVNTSPLPTGDGIGAGYGRFGMMGDAVVDYLGGTFEYGPWRLSAIGARWTMDSMVIRTTYEPDGTGETLDASSRFFQTNASCDLTALADGIRRTFPGLQWTVGVGYRSRTMELAESTSDAWNLNLGTSALLTQALGSNWLQFGASAQWTNVTNEYLVFDLRHTKLPRMRQFGWALAFLQDLSPREGNELRFAVTYSVSKDLNWDDGSFFGDNQFGFELTLFELVALRMGRDENFTIENNTAYGVGLMLPRNPAGRFRFSYDYAYRNSDIDGGDRHLHALSVGVPF